MHSGTFLQFQHLGGRRIKSSKLGAEEMAQKLRIGVALAEDQGAILSTHMATSNSL